MFVCHTKVSRGDTRKFSEPGSTLGTQSMTDATLENLNSDKWGFVCDLEPNPIEIQWNLLDCTHFFRRSKSFGSLRYSISQVSQIDMQIGIDFLVSGEIDGDVVVNGLHPLDEAVESAPECAPAIKTPSHRNKKQKGPWYDSFDLHDFFPVMSKIE